MSAANQRSSASPVPRASRMRVGASIFFATSAVILFGCSSGHDSEDDGASKLVAPATCEGSHFYQGFLRNGATCQDVFGIGGKWEARSLFPGAPRSVENTACSYSWKSSSTPASLPDRAALSRLDGHVAPVCETQCPSGPVPVGSYCPQPPTVDHDRTTSGSMYPSLTTEEEPGGQVEPGGEGGAQGCDVCVEPCTDCAMVESSVAYLVLPPAFSAAHVLEIQTSDHEKRYLNFTPPARHSQSYSVKLPALPPGKSYVEGFTHVY
jgi:hypothetical protein